MVRTLTVAVLGLVVGNASGQIPGLQTMVTIQLTSTGYDLELSRAAAEGLLASLEKIDNEEELAEAVRAKKLVDRTEKARLETELFAQSVARDLPLLREQLRKKMGPRGVVITVAGMPAPPRREWPRLKKLGESLPPFLRAKADKLVKIARTTPVFWTVSPRE